jgi:parallel beta-helix repeat protein
VNRIKSKPTILILFLIISTILGLISISKYTNDFSDNKGLRISKVSSPIYINDADPSYNWSVAKNAGICTGEGTYSDPYLIKGLVIDGSGLDVNGILIENSEAFFIIRACIAHTSLNQFSCGIKLSNVDNGQLINNTCYDYMTNFGIRLDYCNNNNISGNTVNDVYGGGISVRCGVNNTISGNTLIRAGQNYPLDGISIYDSKNTIVSGNTLTDCDTGIKIWHYSMYNTLSGNTISGSESSGINIDTSTNNTVSENIANDNYQEGIYISDIHYNNVTGNTAKNNEIGISLETSIGNTISGNTVNYNDGGGIYLYNSEHNKVSGNTASSNTNDGINLETSNDNTISGNTLNYNSNDGIHLEGSDDNIITGNDLNNNDLGIYLENSERIEMSGNTIDQFALQLVGSLQMLASHDIDNTNLVSGKSIYYYANEVNLGASDFTNGGQVILVNCHDSLISNLDISYCPIGIALYYCNNNTVSGNTANDNILYGILLHESSYNTISGNTLLRNGECIDEIGNCEGNVFSDNGECPYGIVSAQGIPGFVLYVSIGILTVAVISVSIIIILKRRMVKK